MFAAMALSVARDSAEQLGPSAFSDQLGRSVLRALWLHKALQVNPLKSLLSVQEDAVLVAANVDMPVHPIGRLSDVQTTQPSVKLRKGHKHNRSL